MVSRMLDRKRKATVVPVDVEMGQMRYHWDNETNRDTRDTESDHKDDPKQITASSKKAIDWTDQLVIRNDDDQDFRKHPSEEDLELNSQIGDDYMDSHGYASQMVTKRATRRKKAIDWTGPLDKSHYRQDKHVSDQLVQELQQAIPQILRSIKAKGTDLFEWAHQLNGLKGLAQSPDPEIKKGYYAFRSKLDQLIQDTDKTAINTFNNEHGNNPLGWNFLKFSKKRTAGHEEGTWASEIIQSPRLDSLLDQYADDEALKVEIKKRFNKPGLDMNKVVGMVLDAISTEVCPA